MLADSATRAAAGYPDSRASVKRSPLPPPPCCICGIANGLEVKLSDTHEAVQDLKSVCERAGIHRSAAAFRAALEKATKNFDPRDMPLHIRHILDR